MGFFREFPLFDGEPMRTLICFLLCFRAMCALQAQEPLSQDEALKQIYSQYDAGKKTARAQWVCATDRDVPVWPCSEEFKTVSVSVELMSEVVEDGIRKTYLVTSAKPNDDLWHGLFQCHLCRPAIGVGVFAWQSQHWVLQSSNAAVGAFSGYGEPPAVELVRIGPKKHGVMLSADDLTHGSYAAFKVLLMPIDRTVAEVWSVTIKKNYGDGCNLDCDSSATFKFFAANDGGSSDYFDIEVISRGNSNEDNIHLKPENWTEIYRFKDGEYKLLSHKDLVEAKKSANIPLQ
jgi:hypothetical protein